MSDNTWHLGTIHRAADGSCTGTLQHAYPGHDRANVWRHLTDAAELPKWLASGSIEPKLGGRVKIDFADSGVVIDSTVLAWQPQRQLAFSWSHGEQPQRPLDWRLDDADDGTRVTLTVHVPAGEDAAKACAGFEGHLEMLAAALEGVPVKFPFDTYSAARAGYAKQLEA